MKKKRWIAAGIGLVVLGAVVFFLFDGLSEGARVAVNGVDLLSIPDGAYTGEYVFKRWSNTVVVHVQDNRITAIDTETHLIGADSAEIFRRVIDAQNTTVDIVSGATVTTKAYLKAIEDALGQ